MFASGDASVHWERARRPDTFTGWRCKSRGMRGCARSVDGPADIGQADNTCALAGIPDRSRARPLDTVSTMDDGRTRGRRCASRHECPGCRFAGRRYLDTGPSGGPRSTRIIRASGLQDIQSSASTCSAPRSLRAGRPLLAGIGERGGALLDVRIAREMSRNRVGLEEMAWGQKNQRISFMISTSRL